MAGFAVIVGLRVVAAVLQDESNGLAQGIAALELDQNDPSPGMPSEILCQADDDIGMREWEKHERRKVLVLEDSQGSSADPVAANTWRDHTVRIVVAIVGRPDAAAKDFLAAKYIEQAVINTLDRQLLSPEKLETVGVRNAFSIEDATRLDSPAIEQDLGVGKVLTATRYEFLIRHHHP